VASFDVDGAKARFSKLIARVQAGEEVVITKAGEPIAKVIPFRVAKRRQPDTMRGRMWIADDFDAPLISGRPGVCPVSPAWTKCRRCRNANANVASMSSR
jgi:prevent-host-death family protein